DVERGSGLRGATDDLNKAVEQRMKKEKNLNSLF
ncbi:unnamed protein product, partial [marine sediment metagenome]